MRIHRRSHSKSARPPAETRDPFYLGAASRRLGRFSRGTVAAICLVLGSQLQAATAPTPAEPEPDLTPLMPLWNPFYSVMAGAGYKDNLLLASKNREGSSFTAVGGDFTLWKRPAEDGHELQLGISANDRRYLANRSMDHENAFLGHARYIGSLSDRWQWVVDLDAAYFDQVLDLTVLETQINRQRLRQFSLGGGPGLRYRVGSKSWFEITPILSRTWLDGQFDSYDELGGQLSFLQGYGNRSEWRLEFAGRERRYDTRRQATLQGVAIPGTHLNYRRHDIQLVDRHYFDPARRWLLETRLKGLVSDDNGPGYFDYWRIGFAERLQIRLTRWDFKAEIGYNFYNFPQQHVTPTIQRTRGDLSGQFRVERSLRRGWKLFAEFDHDRSMAADPLETFSANTVWAGALWEF